MPMKTRRAASLQPTSAAEPIPTASSSSSRLAPPLTRRLTRSTTVEPSRSPSAVPALTTSTTPNSIGPSNPASRLGSEPIEDLDETSASASDAEDMFGRDGSGLRGRNVEDLGELEEKGLLRRKSMDREDGKAENGTSSPRRRVLPHPTGRSDKGKGREDTFERIVLDEKEDGEEGSQGLTSTRDKQAFALLVLLYLLQGIPLGLTFGTLPFLLKPHLSYSQLAVFALSTWPYSLKLLWSPIVDAWFVPKWGRRKSWIVPVQAVVGAGLWWIGGRVEGWLNAEEVDIRFITMIFGGLILAAATQDIAVDGWALTLLSAPNLSYASTAQTIGLGIGNALAFTVFLAFNSVDFSNRYFRSQPLPYGLLSLGSYMRFWAVVFAAVTFCLAMYKTEDPVSEDDPDMDVKKVYKVMWSIVKLKNIQSFLLIHLVCKIGFQVNESVTSLKLLEKGLSKEDMAVAVLLDFPAQMIAGWLAAKWSRPTHGGGPDKNGKVLRPWIWAFWARLVMASVAALVVYGFPKGEVGKGYFGLVVVTTLLSSLASTVQFVGITAFHTQIADPLIGGTYMTLLNTISNLGGTWPKPLILRSVDVLTTAICSIGGEECVSEAGKHLCEKLGGHCVVQRDGYYIMSAACVVLSVALLMGFILPTVRRLQSLPMSAWRVKIPE